VALRTILTEEGYEVAEAADGEEALAILPGFAPAAVLADVRMPRMDGITLLKRARETGSDAVFVMMTAFASVEAAVEAMRAGAENYLVKPLDVNAVLVVLEKALEKLRLQRDTQNLRERVRERYRFHNIVGDAPELQAVYEVVKRAAPTKATVLILGESGTGKELIAQEIHRLSKRAAGPFVKVNCAAIPGELIESELFGHEKGSFSGAAARRRGQFEVAHGGTLFLDEIGDMSLPAQAKVLRALETSEITRVGGERAFEVDVRVIAATNKDLPAEAREGNFREDLYFRLHVVPITAPALRDRLEDVPLLAERFLQLAVRENGMRPKPVAPEVYERLKQYRWPGNVRELRNVCERMAIMSGDAIAAPDVPEVVAPRAAAPPPPPGASDLSRYGAVPLRELRDLVERDYILKKLEEHDWNITQAAQALGVERTNLHKKIKQHGLSRAGRGGESGGE
jgi:DNA-binding NtrC family response regulator